ncbi:MAG: hypothetical protein EBX17_11700 [Betaproteobacteria bacterium]|nr:hypothetical protein [Betaproteobacteria bacterium]NCW99206.1 hypothetical protein [Betaproteobacteria bacterium]NCX23830.1 hypothetical protein [Betaproteobacteria bacterium]
MQYLVNGRGVDESPPGIIRAHRNRRINLPEMTKKPPFLPIFFAQRDKYLRVAMSCCEFQSYKKKKQLLVTGH